MNSVSGEYLLEKFPGKGGWTYAAIPEIRPDTSNPFGWVQVTGTIDDYQLIKYKLMPMGNGTLFLPLKKALRKALSKEAGDTVRVELKIDNSPTEVPQEILDCLAEEPKEVQDKFDGFSDSEKKAHLDKIYSAKTDETKVKRIAEFLNYLGSSGN